MGIKIYRVLTLALLCQPGLAYRSGNNIVIKQNYKSKPSLLDRKFIFLKTANPQKEIITNSELKELSKKSKSITKTPNQETKTQSTQDEWEAWASNESLDVHAKLLK